MVGAVFRVAAVGLVVALGAACVVENNPPPPAEVTGSGVPVGTGGSTGGGSTTPSATPMLVDVDPNVTMTANPGDGAGVFTEYVSGGHWHVWWTCDTNKTGQPCAFDVKIAAASGAIANAAAEKFATSDTLTTNTDGSIEAVTTTSTALDGVHFDATPGVPITLTASIGGIYSGAFLFFVQKGQVNGGFQGTLTDPLQLEGSAP
jgi:hypothetical protein